MTLKITSAQVVETSVIVNNNSSFQNYTHPDDHKRQTTDTPGFKPFTKLCCLHSHKPKLFPGTHSQSNDFFPYFTRGIGAMIRGILFLEWPEYVSKLVYEFVWISFNVHEVWSDVMINSSDQHFIFPYIVNTCQVRGQIKIMIYEILCWCTGKTIYW